MKVWEGEGGKEEGGKGVELEVCFAPRVSFPPPGRLIRPPPSPSIATCKLYRLAKSAANPSSPKAKIKTRILRQVSSFFLLFSLLPPPSIHCPPFLFLLPGAEGDALAPKRNQDLFLFFFSPPPPLGFAAPKTGGEWREKREREIRERLHIERL